MELISQQAGNRDSSFIFVSSPTPEPSLLESRYEVSTTSLLANMPSVKEPAIIDCKLETTSGLTNLACSILMELMCLSLRPFSFQSFFQHRWRSGLRVWNRLAQCWFGVRPCALQADGLKAAANSKFEELSFTVHPGCVDSCVINSHAESHDEGNATRGGGMAAAALLFVMAGAFA